LKFRRPGPCQAAPSIVTLVGSEWVKEREVYELEPIASDRQRPLWVDLWVSGLLGNTQPPGRNGTRRSRATPLRKRSRVDPLGGCWPALASAR
jgi:hypothetical protein